MAKKPIDRISALEARAAARMQRNAPTAIELREAPSAIIRARMADLPPRPPQSPEERAADTKRMAKRIEAMPPGPGRRNRERLLTLRIAQTLG